jgi:glucose/arabinose dehydrogenase
MRSRAITVALLGALLFAACGGGSNSPTHPTTAGVALAPTGASTPVGSPPAASASATADAGATATPEPPANGLRLDPVLSGLDEPVFVTNAGDGSGRLFVVERGGVIRVARDGQLLPEPFLDITALVESGGTEQGLLGLAFHPDFAHNGLFFVDYTAKAKDSDNTVARYQISDHPDRAEPGSARVLIAQPDIAANHNGGMLAFGPDGYLYIAIGDGGAGGSPNGQKLDTLFGKLLRIDVDHGDPYAIPTDNPFANRADARAEIWAYGLRNPWRFSFDRATGDLWIADVGGTAYEEINEQPAASRGGENYGWVVMEGQHCHSPSEGCDTTGKVLPLVEYQHNEGCAVTGGYVYRGAADPALVGVYLYGDYCSGNIWTLRQDAGGAWTHQKQLATELSISSFGEDEAGELYLTDMRGGAVYRVRAAG